MKTTRSKAAVPMPKPVPNKTQIACPGPLDCMPAANGVKKYFAYVDNGNKPPKTS